MRPLPPSQKSGPPLPAYNAAVDGPLVEGRDYYVDPSGLYVFTEGYLSARGYCCRSGCRHCPYGYHRPSAGEAAGHDAASDFED